jgi:lipoprotein NlpI
MSAEKRGPPTLEQIMSISLLLTVVLIAAPQDDAALAKGVEALKARDYKKAAQLFREVVTKDPKNVEGHWYLARANDHLGDHAAALAGCNKVLELDPKAVGILDLRGAVFFKLGKFKESLADFDRYLELRPQDRAGHWQRGITCYYAGRYEEGYKQFEAYEKVDTNDVENAVWHYLCLAKHAGVDTARKKLLKIGKDQRVPMMVVYDLFAGRAKPEDVLAACAKLKDSPDKYSKALFYGHLYLGLYYDVNGDPKRALDHLDVATENYRLDHYMWDVARVARDGLRISAKQ